MDTSGDRRSHRGSSGDVGRVLLAGAMLSLVMGAALPRPALAWPAITHVHLGEVARQDAVDDGYVTLRRVDDATGAIGEPLGDYEVDANILKALRACPAQYRAGASYADFMPDLLAAQLLVHPDNRAWGNTRSDDWLQRIWARGARAALPAGLTPTSCTQALAMKAYAVGFMTHAAGDMFGHSYINEFAGGSWDLPHQHHSQAHAARGVHRPAYA